MADIKLKEVGNKTIKTLDKAVTGFKNTKENLVEIKRNTDNISTKEETVNQGVSDKMMNSANYGKGTVISTIPKIGNKAVRSTNNMIKLKNKNIKKLTGKASKKAIKSSKVAIKSTQKAVKYSIKTAKETAVATRRIMLAIKQITRASYIAIKTIIIATIKAIKLAIAGTKALISAIIAGGWIAVIIIIVICIIALICGSAFGIFFSNENENSDKNISSVISNLNLEFSNKITTIQNENVYDDYNLEVDRADWREILATYTAKVTGGKGTNEVVTMDSGKEEILKNIFWDIHEVSYEIKSEDVVEELIDDNGVSTYQTVNKDILYIKVNSKTVDEIMNEYNFTETQRKEVNELLKDEYSSLWNSAIYGTSIGSSDIVEVAISQLGNIGGEPYWSWYGFEYRVEWCATFVSWVANETGYIESNTIPKFAGVINGINWFKMIGEWEDSNYIPTEGSIIFFDWEQDGIADHVGIVEKVDKDKVYTIEGNSNNECKQLSYSLNSKVIYGYGTPNY